MASSDPRASNSINDLLDQVVADYVRAVDDGVEPDRDELLAEHPGLADELREFFRHRDRMESMLDPLRSDRVRALNVRCPHCRNTIELVDHAQLTDLNCPSCGSSFSLVATGTGSFPGKLKRIRQFQLINQVGIGQFGSVWKARDLTLERTVAIKIPRNFGGLSGAETEMFLRDARMAAQLNHPNIVGVHEVGKQDDTVYIVSDFIQGATLKEWTIVKRLTCREAVELCVTVARALHHAHESGVIHRDLKPGNIMMDLAGQPHLVDFGLAKRDSGEITMTLEGQILGTPAYMSPEQARGEGHQVDRRADIYSLGVILYEMLTGELPFRGDKQMLMVQILKDPPPSPRKLNVKVPRDLETICLKCLEKEPHGRYDSAELLADECDRFLKGQSVLARPISPLTRGWRWCRRKPLVAGLSAAVATLLIGIAAVSSIGFSTTQAALKISQQRAETIEENLYYSEMNRAASAAQDPDGLIIVSNLLNKWQPLSRQTDRRGWEWYYLETLLHQDLVTLQGHAGAILSVAWSPDGSRLAAAGNNGSIKIWVGSGRIGRTLSGHQAQVNSVAWNQDGSLLASASSDGSVRIWDVETSKTVTTLTHDGPVVALSWSADGERLASASQTVVVTWLADGWKKEQVLGPTPGRIRDLHWHPDGSRLAIGSTKGVNIWTPATGTSKSLKGGNSIAWNRDGTLLAVGRDADVDVWNVEQQERIAIFPGLASRAASWSPKESLLASSRYKVVKLYDVESDTEQRILRGHSEHVVDIAWHPRGQRIATASHDGTVKIWNSTNAQEFSPGAAAIAWDPNQSRYASRIRDEVVICDAQTSRVVKRLQGHASWVYAIAWSPNGQNVATAGYGGEVRVWDVESGEGKLTLKTQLIKVQGGGPGWYPAALAWSPDSVQLAFKQSKSQIRIVDVSTGRILADLDDAAGTTLRSFAWSPDGVRIVATTGQNKVVNIWNSQTGRLEKALRSGTNLNAVCWSPDGTRIAGAGGDTSVRVWDVATGQRLHALHGHTTYVKSVSWSSDGSRIASSDESGSVRIWDAENGQQTITLAYPGPAPMVAWSSDSKSLACVGYGGSAAVKIWKTTNEPSSIRPYW